MNSGNESACLGNVKQHITSIDIERESRNTSSVCEDNGNDSHEMEEDADEVTAVTIAKRSCFAIAAKEGKNIEQNPTDLVRHESSIIFLFLNNCYGFIYKFICNQLV